MCIRDRSTGKPEEIFLSGSDPRIPQTVEVLSIENRSVQYEMCIRDSYLKGHIIGRERMRHRIVCMVAVSYTHLHQLEEVHLNTCTASLFTPGWR